MNNIGGIVKLASLGVVAVVGLGVLFSGYYTIDEGEKGVVLTNGRVTDISSAGFHLKLPFVQHVKYFPIRQRSMTLDNEAAYSSDSQVGQLRISVNWSPASGDKIIQSSYQKYGSVEGMQSVEIERKVSTALKTVFGRYRAMDIIRQRDKVNSEIADELKRIVPENFIIESVQTENIAFSDAFQKAAEDQARTEVEVRTKKQELEKERVDADIRRTKAEGEAASNLAIATAAAEATKRQGDASAYSIRVKGEALRDNPNILELERISRWNGEVPTTMVPGASVPMINIK